MPRNLLSESESLEYLYLGARSIYDSDMARQHSHWLCEHRNGQTNRRRIVDAPN